MVSPSCFRAARLVAHLEQDGVRADPAALAFYIAAYAAFRVGMITLACSQAFDAPEQNRLERASAFYRHALKRALIERPVPAAS